MRRLLPPARLRRRIALGLAALAVTGACAAARPLWPVAAQDQPVALMPAASAGDTLAVIYSGDGGWAPLDRTLAASLAQHGVPVIGYDSLHYFASARTPDGAAGDLATALRRELSDWHREKIALIGYSFGADALPAIIPELPADLRARVQLVVLVGLGQKGELKWQPSSWLSIAPADAWPTRPTVEALKATAPMLCVYGAREQQSLCPALPETLIHRVKLPGDHHYNGDYRALTQTILQALPPARAGSAGSRSAA